MSSGERVIVLGAGVAGLTTAVRLLERGFKVDVVADRHQPATTGNLAGGLWYPYKASGPKVADWALASLAVYRRLAEVTESGVRRVRCTSSIPSDEPRPFWADSDVDFEDLAPPEEVEATRFRSILPIAEPAVFLPWLESRIADKGGVMRLLDRSLGHISALPGMRIVNCTGLGARHLCRDDSVFPIRGVVVHVAGTGIDECITDDTDLDRPTYIIPARNFCVLGGSAEPDRWDTSVSNEETQDILERCARLDPRVRKGTVLGAYAGLRPGRREVRLEAEPLPGGRTVIHNYGHGGSGFTLAWGCADEVVEMVAAAS